MVRLNSIDKSCSNFGNTIKQPLEILNQDEIQRHKIENQVKVDIMKSKARKKFKREINANHRATWKIEKPSWFRELSSAQMTAADLLHANIREDIEQGTVHRCRQALLSMGLKPLVNIPGVRLALKICNGNVFAFLWFMMEFFYDKTCVMCQHSLRTYTINEQIILSAICHLDMISTLRCLDTLLPTPEIAIKKHPKKAKKQPVTKYDSPYLEPLKRPIFHNSSSHCVLPTLSVKLLPYDTYLEQNFIVRNEKTKWLASSDEAAPSQIESNPSKSDSPQVVGIIEKCSNRSTHMKMKQKVERTFTNLSRCTDSTYLGDLNAKEKPRHIINRHCMDCTKHFLVSKHCVNPKFNEEYFRGPRISLPYKFNYEKIFQIDDSSKKSHIKRKISAALGIDENVPENEALEIYIRDIYQNEMKLSNNKINIPPESVDQNVYNNFCQLSNRKTSKHITNNMEDNKPNISFRDSICIKKLAVRYNPKDGNQMNELLKSAINKMKQDPKFVLASLPHAHKLPILQEWIRARYGLVYTRIERAKALKKSLRQFEKLLIKDFDVARPLVDEVWPQNPITYALRNTIYNKTNHVVKNFNHEMRLAFLRDAEICWQVLNPYHCTSGPPRDVFFAYMPACEYEVFGFRPWKTNETVNAKDEYEKRISKKRRDN